MEIKNLKVIRYWGRKPPSMILSCIEEFTNKGELVLDPFGGSGNIVKTALALGRRAIYVDLNPFAKLIAESTILGCPLEKLREAIEMITQKKDLEIKTKSGRIKKLNREKLFSIKCPCGRSIEFNSITFTRVYIFKSELGDFTKLQKKILNLVKKHKLMTHEEMVKKLSGESRNGITYALKKMIKSGAIIEEIRPLKVIYARPCSCGRTRLNNISDIHWIIKGPIYPAYWYPKNRLEYPNGIAFLKKRDIENIYELFEDRTLAFLSYLWHIIRQLRIAPSVKRCLYLIFMATLARSSKMNRESGGTWPINSYWIPRNYVIRNPFYVFLRSAKDFICKFSKYHHAPISGDVLKVIKGRADVAFLLGDARKLALPAKSIDYVITDPPHVDETQFFELSSFYISWMRKKLDFKNEFIVNPRQGKDLTKYLKMYAEFILEVKRVLKSGRYFTVILHEEDDRILKECREITENLGFTLYKFDKLDDFYIFTFCNCDMKS